MNFFYSDRVDKWSDKLSNFVSQASEKVKEVASATLNKDTPLEKNLKEATSDKNWGSSSTILLEIAKGTFHYNEYFIVMKMVWDCLSEKPSKWRKIFKTLTLLEYLLKHGSEKVVDEVRENLYKIKALYDFHFIEEGRDKGNGIREKAKVITQLVTDNEFLKTEKEIARTTREKVVGIGSHGERTGAGYTFSVNFDQSVNNNNENFFSSRRKYDPYDSSKSKIQSEKELTKRIEKENEKDKQKAEKEKAKKERERFGGKELTSKTNVEKCDLGKSRRKKEEKSKKKANSLEFDFSEDEVKKKSSKKDEEDRKTDKSLTRSFTASSCESADSAKKKKKNSKLNSRSSGNEKRSLKKNLFEIEEKKCNEGKGHSNSLNLFFNDVDWSTFESASSQNNSSSSFENNFDLFANFTSAPPAVNTTLMVNSNVLTNNNVSNINTINNSQLQQQMPSTYNMNPSMNPITFSNDFFSYPSNTSVYSFLPSSSCSSINAQSNLTSFSQSSLSLSFNRSLPASAAFPYANLSATASNNPFTSSASSQSQNIQASSDANKNFLSDLNCGLIDLNFKTENKTGYPGPFSPQYNSKSFTSFNNFSSSALHTNPQNNFAYMNTQQHQNNLGLMNMSQSMNTEAVNNILHTYKPNNNEICHNLMPQNNYNQAGDAWNIMQKQQNNLMMNYSNAIGLSGMPQSSGLIGTNEFLKTPVNYNNTMNTMKMNMNNFHQQKCSPFNANYQNFSIY